jgi:hypothetical protein
MMENGRIGPKEGHVPSQLTERKLPGLNVAAICMRVDQDYPNLQRPKIELTIRLNSQKGVYGVLFALGWYAALLISGSANVVSFISAIFGNGSNRR